VPVFYVRLALCVILAGLALPAASAAQVKPADAELLQVFQDINLGLTGPNKNATPAEIGKSALLLAKAQPCTNEGAEAQALMEGRLTLTALGVGITDLAHAILAKQKDPAYIASPAHVADIHRLEEASRALAAARQKWAANDQKLNKLILALRGRTYCDGALGPGYTPLVTIRDALEKLGLSHVGINLPNPATNPDEAANGIASIAQSSIARSLTKTSAVMIANELYEQLDEISARTLSGREVKVEVTVSCNLACTVAAYPAGTTDKLLPGDTGSHVLGIDEAGVVSGRQTITVSIVGRNVPKKKKK
jgi:hypothetical protein